MNTLDSLNTELTKKIESMLEVEGAELIESKLYFQAGDYSLRCLIDYINGGITVDKCVLFNRKIVEFLEETKMLGDSFVVEVNSPGLDRPLRTYKDFFRMKGKTVGVWLKILQEDKNYLEGIITDVTEQSVAIEMKGKNYIIDFAKINLGKEKLEV